ncbi:recombinase family protein [Xanthomonas sp. NCPPB 2632]|uniref:recombinase family protein n=1 Tax=Xanthomonas sp. NCPPB 2632 TaxID=3240912 RepID=UPI003517662B
MSLSDALPRTSRPVMVAEYLRMSTDKQDTSISNQRAAIAAYAATHNMLVLRSFEDEGRSGLDLAGRPALTSLLGAVEAHTLGCTAILVLDVSRWGRFQDVDEAAFYEHLCTRNGVRVIYVAELFGDDTGPLGALLKGLKRSMAAEYSRELSAKVFAGQARLIRAGFTMGGPAPYGLQRVLIDASGRMRAMLAPGERKSIASDRVRLALGPHEEVRTVRWMFRQAAAAVRLPEIVKRLNDKGSRTRKGRQWSVSTVRDMLEDERYIGTTTFGKDCSRAIAQPPGLGAGHGVIRVEHAFPALVSSALFYRAREVQRRYSTRLTDEEILEAMIRVWKRHGRISSELLAAAPDAPSPQVYLRRFGSLRAAYLRIGYVQNRDLSYGDIRDRIQVWQESVIRFVEELLIDDGSTVERNSRLLCIDRTWTAQFQLMQSSHVGRNIRWALPTWLRQADIYVGIRMDRHGDRPLDYLVLPAVGRPTWPARLDEHPDAGAGFFIFQSLRIFRELAALSRPGSPL